MAVEKMVMMNVVAPIEKINHIAKEIVLLGNVHIVNALNEINESNFTLDILEENMEELVDMCAIRPYCEEADYKDMKMKINNVMKHFGMKASVKERYLKESYDFNNTMKKINEIYSKEDEVYQKIANLQKELKHLKELDNHIKHMKQLEIDLDRLNNLKYFNYKMGILSKENRIRLKRNYENISAVVLHVGSNRVGEVYLVISPKELETETDRILRSLNFHELDVPKEFSGTPKEVSFKIEKREDEIKTELIFLNNNLNALKKKYQSTIDKAYSRLVIEEKSVEIKKQTACTNNFFYLSGWVPKREKDKINNRFKQSGHEVIVMFKETAQVYKYIIPPTKLKNSRLFSPFEILVKMYGIPSYDELDPTKFLSITYMLLFGAMFGDVGHGLVLLLMGLYFNRKEDKRIFGEILIRLGTSSILFGVLYGSVFGFEHFIPALLIRPIENIDYMLAGSVIIGIIFLIIGFSYGIFNAFKQKNLQEGLFGRNGLTGLLFYIMLLIAIFNAFMGIEIVQSKVCYTFIVIFMGIMFVREPLSNLILKKRPLYRETASSYYVESGFDLFETLMNMVSNTISFIRVGAFALNHVGLFIAFQTMAKMINNFAGSIVIFITGNIIIIGLEGLIVFIQGLRLEYYEMFSKYYKGEGIEFNPVKYKT